MSVLLFLGGTSVYSDTYYWVGSGVSPAWNNGANWSLTSGGAGGAGVPGLTDEVWISSDIWLTGDVSVKTVYIQGTVNLNLNGYNLDVTSNGAYNYANLNSEYFAGAIHLGRDGTAGNLTLSGTGKLNVEIFDEEEAALNSLSIGENATVTVSGHMWTDANTAAYGVNLSGTGKFVMAAGSHIASGSGGYYGFKIDSGVQVVDPDNLLSLCEWLGGTDSDWNKGSNWRYKHVPKAGDDVIILNVPNKPVISGAAVSIGKLTVNTGATVSFAESLTITDFEGTGTLINTNTTGTQKRLVVNSTSDVTIPYVESHPGTQNIAVENRNHSTVLTINSFMSNNEVELYLYGNINFSTSAIVKSFYVSDGTVTVDSSITVTGDLTTSGTGGNLVLSGSSAPVTIGGNLLNYYSIDLNGNDVTFTGTSPVVEGNVDFGNLDATACTNLTFNGKVKVAGNFVSASTKTVFKSDADFSSATGYTGRGFTDFFNTRAGSSPIEFKTFSGMDLGTFYFGGNTDVVINGAVTAYQYRIPDNGHGYNMTQTFEARTLSGSGTPKLTITNFFDIGRSSSSAAVTGKCIIDCDVDYTSKTSGQVHVGSNLIIKAGKTFDARPERIVGTSGTANPHPLIEVYGNLITGKSFDLAQNNNNPSCTRLIVYSGGTVTAQKIEWSSTKANYFDTADPLTVENGGTIEVTDGIDVIRTSNAAGTPELACVNNGTIKVTGAGTVAASYFTGNGTIEFADVATLDSVSTTKTSSQQEIICGDSVTVKGAWNLTDFTATGLGGKTITLDGSTVGVSGTLSLSGSSDSSLLKIAGAAATDGFVLSADQSGNGAFLSIDDKTGIFDSTGVVRGHTYEATDSVPEAGTGDDEYLAVMRNGWNIKALRDFHYVWTGTASTEWNEPLNWNTGIVPVEECSVEIPDAVASGNWPVLTSLDGEISIGNLSAGTSAGDAKITLAENDIVLADSISAPFLNVFGSVIYTDAGRIKIAGVAVNDDLNGGTVEYAGTDYTGTVSDVPYANLKISDSSWTASAAVTVSGELTVADGKLILEDDLSATAISVSGGQIDVADEKTAASDLIAISGGKFSGTFSSETAAGTISVTGLCSASGDFTFVTDSVSVTASVSEVTANTVTAALYPFSNDKKVVFGTDAGSFALSNAQAAKLGVKTIILGNENNTAGLEIKESVNVNSGIYLITGGAMTQLAGGHSITSVRGELGLQASSGIGTIGGTPVTIGSVNETVSAKITDVGDICLKINSSADTKVGGAGSKVILTPNGSIELQTAGNMIIGGNVSASGTITLSSSKGITTTGGTISTASKVTLSAVNGIGTAAEPLDLDCGSVKAVATGALSSVNLMQNGTLTVDNAGDISAAGAVTLKAAAFDFAADSIARGTGTVTLTGYEASSALAFAQAQFDGINSTSSRKIVLGDSSNSGGITFAGDITIDANITDVTVNTNEIVSSSAAFKSGIVVLNPAGPKIAISGNFEFYNLEASGLGGKEIDFAAGSVTSITNNLTLKGTSTASLLKLRSSTEDSQWTITASDGGVNTIQFVDIKDSFNGTTDSLSVPFELTALNSVDAADNDYWSFPGHTYTWTGADASDGTKWKAKDNWNPKSIPGTGSLVVIADVSADSDKWPELTEDISLGTTYGTLTVNDGAQMDFAGFSFTAKTITNNGTVKFAGGNTLTGNLSNGTALSTVIYYGDCGTTLPWSLTSAGFNSYKNVYFADGAAVDYTVPVSVSGTIVIANGAGNQIALKGANRFTNGISVGDLDTGFAAGDIELNGENSSIKLNRSVQCGTLVFDCKNITCVPETAVPPAISSPFIFECTSISGNNLTFNCTETLVFDCPAVTATGTSPDGILTFASDVVVLQDTVLTGQNVVFGKNLSGAVDVTVNGKAGCAASEHVFDLRDISGGIYKTLTVNDGFANNAYVTLKGNGVIKGDNRFAKLKVLNNEIADSTTLVFDDGSTQTVANPKSAAQVTPPVTGELYFAGNGAGKELTVTSETGADWNAVFTNKILSENFERVIINHCHSVLAGGLANDLKIIPSMEHVRDSDLDAYTSKYWFSYGFWWFGQGADSSWKTHGNWCYDENGTIPALGYPDYINGTSEIVIAGNNPQILELEENISIKNLTVNKDLQIDLKTFDVSLSQAGPAIENDGTIRLSGEQTVLMNGTDISISAVNAITVDPVEGINSTVEYYGSCASATETDRLALSYTYNNLVFSYGADAYATTDMTVNGEIKITNGAGNSLVLSGDNIYAGTVTLDDAGSVNFSGSNSYGGLVTVTKAENVILNGNAGGFELADNAECTSLETGCAVILGSVTTTGNQDYKKTVTLKTDSTFAADAGSLVKFEGPVICRTDKAYALEISGGDGEFGADVDVKSLAAAGTVDFANPVSQTITTATTQTYTGKVTVASAVNINSQGKIHFQSDVAGTGSLAVNAGNDTVEADGKIGETDKVASLALSAGTIILHGGYDVTGTVNIAAAGDDGTISLNTADLISGDKQTLTAKKGVRLLSAATPGAASWTAGTKNISLTDTEFFADFSGSSVTLGSDLTADSIYLYNGTFDMTGRTVNSVQNIAFFGANYSSDDPRFDNADTRFAFYGFDSLNYKPVADGVQPAAADFSAVVTSGSGTVLKAGKNFYVNGTDLNGCTVKIPSDDASNPVFNPANDVTERQWGIPYAVAINSTVTGVTSEGGWICAGGADGISGEVTQGCVDGGGNTNVQFAVPHIDQAYSVYDDVIFVHFDMLLENSHGEIAANLALLSGTQADGGIWYSGASYKITGAWADADCVTPVSADTDIQEFYIRGEETWNTDATGTDSFTASVSKNESSDRNGIKKSVTTDLSFLEGLFTSAEGHTMCRNYVANPGAGRAAYTETQDKASPVLIAVYSGQEQHSAGSSAVQPVQDGHNFIEFRYSEPVNVRTGGADMDADGSGTNENVPAVMADSASGLVIDGFGSIASGSVASGIKPGTSVTSPHMFYRAFATAAGGDNFEVQPYRIRLSVAGAVDGTVTHNGISYHNYAGYIDSAATPSGDVTRIANDNIKDLSGNVLDSAGTAAEHVLPQLVLNGYSDMAASNHLYGKWDTLPPVFAPFVSDYSAWTLFGSTGTGVQHEIIGSSSGTFIDNIEIHMYDNNSAQVAEWSGKWWRTKRGWFQGSGIVATDTLLTDESGKALPDTRGGSRPFDGNITKGGIRRSSLMDANSSFSYKSIDDNVESAEKPVSTATHIDQENIRNAIFRAASDPATEQDGLYLKLPMADGDNTLPVRTTFAFSYNPVNDYITDLAGNRLASSYAEKTTFQSIDLTPPAYTMALSPVADNKVYIFFTKRLAYYRTDNTIEYLDLLSDAELTAAMNEIKTSFVICPQRTSSEAIVIQKVDLVRSNNDYTTLLFTLERNLTVSDIKSLWIRDKGVLPQITDTSTGLLMNNTKINDYVGNFLPQDKAHAISDFAINSVKPVYGFAHAKNDDGWDEQGIYGNIAADADNYAVHDFTRNQGNYGRFVTGRDITLQVQCIEGKDSDGKLIAAGDSYTLMPSKKAGLTHEMVSDKINKLIKGDWRLWLPTELKSLATQANTNMLASVTGVSAGDDDGLLFNYTFKDEDYGFKGGDEIQFVFQMDGVTIDHDADGEGANPTPPVPLYAVTMPENVIRSGDLAYIDLWSFGLKNIKQQRGGVTILNNVIDVSVKEETVLEVEMAEAGNLNIYVLTADGNIVKQLSKGQTSEGIHYFKWNGTNNKGNTVARGIYFIRIIGNGIDETRKVLCVK